MKQAVQKQWRDRFYVAAIASWSNPNVAFNFKHQMSKVSLNIANGGAAETKAELYLPYCMAIDGTDTTGKVKSIY